MTPAAKIVTVHDSEFWKSTSGFSVYEVGPPVAIEVGVVLEARRFDAVRAFPETRDFVPGGAQLLPGPGGSLYVVNYDSDAMSKIRTSDMQQIQRVPTGHHPIGITYDKVDHRVWVACYSGSLYVFDDAAP